MRPENMGVSFRFKVLLTTPDTATRSPRLANSFAAGSRVLCGCGVQEQASDLVIPDHKIRWATGNTELG